MRLSELGLGPAIILRSRTTQHELSSVFWFSVFVASILSAICYGGASLPAWFFNEPRLLALTRAVSVLFLLQSLQVVPSSLLKKRLDFKRIGQIEILAAIISAATMLIIAKRGGGVWTLICGSISLAAAQVIFTSAAVQWLPSFHYRFKDVRWYFRFGVLINLQGTLFYIYDQSDKFFAGRAWQPTTLGQYSLALQLAQLPSDKITVLINQVAFPTFSLLASDHVRFRNFYLKTVSVCATLVFPLFVGGFMMGSDLVQVLLSEKWAPIGRIFEYLCLAQLMVSLGAINSFVHNAQNRVSWSSLNTIVYAILVPLSFYLAVPYGLEAALIPWFTTYLVLSLSWIAITINKIGITPSAYLKALFVPFAATFTMATAIQFVNFLGGDWGSLERLSGLIIKVGVGVSSYILFLWLFDRTILTELKALSKR